MLHRYARVGARQRLREIVTEFDALAAAFPEWSDALAAASRAISVHADEPLAPDPARLAAKTQALVRVVDGANKRKPALRKRATAAQRAAAVARLRAGESSLDLGKEFGVHRTSITTWARLAIQREKHRA